MLSMNAHRQNVTAVVDTLKNDPVAFIGKLVREPSLPGEEGRLQPLIAAKLASPGFSVMSKTLNRQGAKVAKE